MKACVCALGAVVVSACFDPDLSRAACGVNGECPAGKSCNTALQTCELGIADGGGVGSMSGACGTGFSAQVDTCQLSLNSDITLDGAQAVYDTDAHQLTGSAASMAVMHMVLATKGSMVDAILVHDLHLTANSVLRGTGSLPLAIIASGMITLDSGSFIDVSAGGAGARPSCSSPAGTGAKDTSGGGGGGGGGFAGSGGHGGKGDIDNTPSNGGFGASSQSMPQGPLGGCAGAKGGDGISGGGAGGPGGGALYLVSADRISMGTIAILNAGGGGARGGSLIMAGSSGFAGGGGGGSGGMIWLEAPHVVGPSALIIANGGSGGEGSGSSAAGQNGENSNNLSAEPGGSGNAADGGDGGNGGFSAQPAGSDATDFRQSGGGGGGGGVGYIHVVSPDQQLGATSPNPS